MKEVGVWFRSLSITGRVVVVSVATLLLFGAVGSMAQPNKAQNNTQPIATTSSSPTPTPITKIETKIEPITFLEETREEGTITKGQTKVSQEGVNGERTITYEVVTLDGKETSRKEIKNEITKAPINRITLVGTYVAPTPTPKQASSCDPNYSGKCVPIASDVDCAGGSGNGPAYTSGPVYIIGSDIYDLDRDGNGIGCE
jgi:hypothetical protein